MKHVLTVLALSLLLVSWSLPADAAVGWFKAKVIRAGVTKKGAVIVQLTHQAGTKAFEGKNFVIPDLVSKEMLAIGLTALAVNLSIRVRTDPDEPGVPEIRTMYLLNK